MKKKTFFPALLFALIAICSTASCKKGTTNTSTSLVPIGTTVKLEATIASGTQIPVVQYYDAQQNTISKTNVANNWSYTYQTTKDNQFILLQLNGSTVDVTGKIYINGVQKKEATGTIVSIVYP